MRSDFDFPIEKPKLLRPSVNVVRQKEYAEEKRKAQCNLIAKMLTMSDTELMTLSTREILEYSHNSNPVQVGDEGSESGSDNELPRNLQESDSDNEGSESSSDNERSNSQASRSRSESDSDSEGSESSSDNEERLISPRKTQFPRITSGSERSSQDYTPQKLPQKTPKSTPQPRTPQPNTPIQIQRPALQAKLVIDLLLLFCQDPHQVCKLLQTQEQTRLGSIQKV
ncbi:hypothetical protein FDP41_001398 [Naegleria fowleri]|uniref:Uncharacterized protein n=1 Tax=Naegleria fowleri TaxID=5763 RepID=A0A6A5C1H6_NAEFO|nr:uncharacterized protein FDP41_001398 [Naegleria fowleri]KAF0979730.1 hypothetical protein FDP41_001398 [Naegleria fowleri]